jgi:cytochrome c oxidase subunit 1
MGITYWLVPYLTGRELWSRRVALTQAWLWFVGMAIFSHFMHQLGMPRRTMIGSSPYLLDSWKLLLPMTAVGGLLMFASAALYYLNMIMTITRGKPSPGQVVPFARAISGPEDVPAILDRFTPWLALAATLILINYGPTLFDLVTNARLNIPGLSPW